MQVSSSLRSIVGHHILKVWIVFTTSLTSTSQLLIMHLPRGRKSSSLASCFFVQHLKLFRGISFDYLNLTSLELWLLALDLPWRTTQNKLTPSPTWQDKLKMTRNRQPPRAFELMINTKNEQIKEAEFGDSRLGCPEKQWVYRLGDQWGGCSSNPS